MHSRATSLLLAGLAFVAGFPQDPQTVNSNRKGFVCPEPYGTFEDEYQCDKYWECDDGLAKPKLCEDGLVFDIFKADAGNADPCESPYVVDCGQRLELQKPTFVSEFCPRKNGIFADPDPTVCTRFYTCITGHATVTDCSAGLHFDEVSGNCAWPQSAGRVGCDADKKECLGDFCCSGEEVLTADGVKLPHPTYPNLQDCQKFYVCLNGITPQESSCGAGEVYNERSGLCDYPEYVPECHGWYKDDPRFADLYQYEDAAPGTDVGAQDTPGV